MRSFIALILPFFFHAPLYAATSVVHQPSNSAQNVLDRQTIHGYIVSRKRLREFPMYEESQTNAEELSTNTFTSYLNSLEETSDPENNSLKKRLLKTCYENDVFGLIGLYSSISKRDKSLLPCFLFPKEILNISPYASLKEENSATQLSVLLAAVEGNLEAKILVLSQLEETIPTKSGQDKLADYRKKVTEQLNQHSQLNDSTEELMIVKTTFGLNAFSGTLNIKTASPRVLVRLASYYLDQNQTDEACKLFSEAGRKGNIYAVTRMYYLLLHDQEVKLPAYKPFVDQMIKTTQGTLNGYAYLLSAYESQFGLNGKTRDLQQANGLYHQAIDCRCREASYEYGELLRHIADSLSESEKSAKKNELYESAAKNYEESGNLGLTQGFIKAAEIYQSLIDGGITVNPQSVEQLLISASKVALDDAVIKYCQKRKISDNVSKQIQSNYEKIHAFLEKIMDNLLRTEEKHESD